jgi:hypothetical protein
MAAPLYSQQQNMTGHRIYESSNPVFELIAYTSLLLSVLDLLYVGSCDASKGTRKDIGLHALTIAQCSMGSCSELGW